MIPSSMPAPQRRSSAFIRADYRRLMAPKGADGDDDSSVARPRSQTGRREDLPYRVELWNQAGTAVEQVLAETASASIGFAAYYAAAREYPDRTITLRHKNSIVSKSN